MNIFSLGHAKKSYHLEIQFQLSHMYNILGEEGYKLHKDLIDASSDACEKGLPPIDQLVDYHDSNSLPSPNVTSKQSNPLLFCECAERNRTGSYNDSFDSYISEIMVRLNKKEITKSEANKIVNLLIENANDNIKMCPRDISLHLCLQTILKVRYMLNGDDSDLDQILTVLDRSLELANQAGALGMVGWYEHESSTTLDRMLERSLDILGNMAAFFGSIGDWDAATSLLWSLLLRCEQQIPLYHPITLCCMLDLATALLEIDQSDTAHRVVHRANQRLSMYLVEQEEMCIKVSKSNENDDENIQFQKSMAQDSLFMLQAFTVKMKRLERRLMLTNLADNHPMRIMFHCFLGDTLCVLANCTDSEHVGLKSGKGVENKLNLNSSDSSTKITDKQHNLWALAGEYYRLALTGWVKIHGIRHPNVPATSCGLARCLRELGRREEAIVILSSAVGTWRGTSPLKQHPFDNDFKTNSTGKIGQPSLFSYSTSKPKNEQQRKNSSTLDLAVEEGLAMCLWWMAVYFVECSPSERGRIRALSLLQASSESLRLAFKKSSKRESYEMIKFSDLLATIESEAKHLFSAEINANINFDLMSDPEKLGFVLSSVQHKLR